VQGQEPRHGSLGSDPVAHLERVDLGRRETVSTEIARRLLSYLLAGNIQPGERMPSERKLAAAFGRRGIEQAAGEFTARNTDHRALDALQRIRQMRIVDAEFTQQSPPRGRPRRDRVARLARMHQAMQLEVHDLSDSLGDRAGPVELRSDRTLGLAGDAQTRRPQRHGRNRRRESERKTQ